MPTPPVTPIIHPGLTPDTFHPAPTSRESTTADVDEHVRAVAAFVGLDEPKGLDVKAELDGRYGTGVDHGRLYPNLDTLVEKGRKDDRTNEYTLTDRGRRELVARREWEGEVVGTEVEAAA